MKGINNKWKATIALVALFWLASCSNVPVDNNTGSTTGGSTQGNGSGGSTGSGSGGNGSGNSGGGSGTGNTGGGGYTNGTGGNTGSGSGTAGNGGEVHTQSYVVQLIATSSSAKADAVKNTFVNEGYRNTVVNTIVKDGKHIHRVQIGPYGTQADGDRVLAQMKRRYHKNQYVNNAIVKTIYGR